MAGFYHFIPELTRAKAVDNEGRLKGDVLAMCELLLTLEDCRCVPDETVAVEGAGPNGLTGLMLYPKGTVDPPTWGYSAERQTWRVFKPRTAGRMERWVGWDMEQPPNGEALQRRRLLPDYKISVQGDEPWFAPCARAPDMMSRSSVALVYGVASAYTDFSRSVGRSDREIWELAGELLAEGDQLTEERKVEIAFRCLQKNYRIDACVVSCLRELGVELIGSANVAAILQALIDFDLKQEWDDLAKKNGEAPAARMTASAEA